MKTLKRVIKSSFILLAFFLLVVSRGDCLLSQEVEDQPALKIYYVPFDTETLVPITMDTIEAQSSLAIWIYDNDKLVSEILDLIQAEKTSVDISRVTDRLKMGNPNLRVKIGDLRDGTVYFIGFGGGTVRGLTNEVDFGQAGIIGLTNRGEQFVLTKAQAEKLEAKIISLRGVVHKNIERFLKYDVEHYTMLEKQPDGIND